MGGDLIVFEGIDGAGKTTVMARVSQALEERGIRHINARLPGGTSFGEEVREWFFHDDNNPPLAPLTKLLLQQAVQAQLTHEVLLPALETDGMLILLDRYYPSTVAYQAHFGGNSIALTNQIIDATTANARPKLTLLLVVPTIDAYGRLKADYEARLETETVDDEALHEDFTINVDNLDTLQASYIEQFQRDQQNRRRWVMIDAGQDLDKVVDDVLHAIEQRVGVRLFEAPVPVEGQQQVDYQVAITSDVSHPAVEVPVVVSDRGDDQPVEAITLNQARMNAFKQSEDLPPSDEREANFLTHTGRAEFVVHPEGEHVEQVEGADQRHPAGWQDLPPLGITDDRTVEQLIADGDYDPNKDPGQQVVLDHDIDDLAEYVTDDGDDDPETDQGEDSI